MNGNTVNAVLMSIEKSPSILMFDCCDWNYYFYLYLYYYYYGLYL